MDTVAVGIGERIKQAREIHNTPKITQEGVVFRLRERGYPTVLSTFQRWEKTGLIQAHELTELADILGVPQMWLAEGGDLEDARVHKLVDEMREDGFSEAEIVDTLLGLQNAKRAVGSGSEESPEGAPSPPEEVTEETSAQPEGAPPSPEEIAEELSRRPGGAKGRRGRVPKPRRNPEPPPTSGEEEPS